MTERNHPSRRAPAQLRARANGGRVRPALEFFAGCGLAAEGLKPFFTSVWANDISEKKAATYVANHPTSPFHLGSIEHVNGASLPTATLAWASFPCQDLSLAGNLGGIGSKRSGLVWQWLRVLDEMPRCPPLLAAENVLGLVSAAKGEHYRQLHQALEARGYKVGAVVLDAIHWLPQSRPRVFVVAVSEATHTADLEASGPLWCHPSSLQRAAGLAPRFRWWRLPMPKVSRKHLEDLVDFDAAEDEPRKSRHNLSLIPDSHRERMTSAVNGHHTVFPGYKRTRSGRQVLELRFDNVAGCLRTPEGGSSRQVLVMYRDGRFSTRLLTVRETARLMGARESYRIEGTYNDGYKAMGDAVAVPAVRHLARYLLSPLAERAAE